MTDTLRKIFLPACLVFSLACSGSTTGSKSVTRNYLLQYSKPEAVYFVNQAIAPNLPSVTPVRSVTSYSVEPALPAGLNLDTAMGSISGIPSAANSRTAYTITATTNGLELTTTVYIRVGYPGELNQVMIDYYESMTDLTNSSDIIAAGIYDRDDDSLLFRAILYPFAAGTTEIPYTLYNHVRNWAQAQGYSTFSSGQKGADTASDDTGDANMPVTRVSFLSAAKTANAFSEMARLEPVYYEDADSDGLYTAATDTEVFRSGTELVMNYHANGFRLPTESEWEFACRALTTDGDSNGATDFRKYFYGDTDPTDATYGNWDFGNDDGETTWISGSVATAVNDFGLFDMMGNVREWVWDYSLSTTQYSAQTGDRLLPKGPFTGDNRVRRGGQFTIDDGSFDENKLQCSGHGSSLATASSASDTGFRLVRSLTSEKRDLTQVDELSYSQNQSTITSVTFNLQFPIEPLYPVYDEGLFRVYSVTPGLPAGLTLDPNTGQISGQPTVLDSGTDYTITASSPAGEATYAVNITVQVHSTVTAYMSDMVTATAAPIQAGIYLRDVADQKMMDVRLPAFKLHAYETAFSMYEFITDWAESYGGYTIENSGQRGSDASDNDTGDDSMPATEVSWYSAVLAANALSQLANLTPVYYIDSDEDGVYSAADTDLFLTDLDDDTSGNGLENKVSFNLTADGFRLPTEAEWEFACRGITTDGNSDGATDFSLYPWGSATLDDSLANLDSGTSGTIVSGTLAANPIGLYDMSGNVREWVWDNSSATSVYHRQFGSLGYHNGPTAFDKRVRRGGSHEQTTGDSEFFQCSGHGSSLTAGSISHTTGFRLAQTISDGAAVTNIAYHKDGNDTSGSTTVGIHQIVNIYPVLTGGTATGFAISGTLPAGLTFDAGSGIVSGTPSATASATDLTITVTHSGGSDDYTLNLTVNGVSPDAQDYIDAMQSVISGSAATYTIFRRDDAGAGDDPDVAIYDNTSDPFSMGATEVSFRLYEQVRRYGEANGYDGFDDGLRGRYTTTGTDEISLGDADMPVIANWDSAVLFANALSEMSGLNPIYYKDDDGAGSPDDVFDGNDTLVYRDIADVDYGSGDDLVMNFTANGYRLPTESEWEYACRASATYLKFFYNSSAVDLTAPSDLTYGNWDHDASDDDSTWISGTGGVSTMNSFGLYDMMGNVREWVWDWSSGETTYEGQTGPFTDHLGPTTGTNKVRRSGDFQYNSAEYEFLQCSSHGSSEAPDDTSLNAATGFRIVVRE